MSRRWAIRLAPRGRRRSAARLLGRDLQADAGELLIDDIRDAAKRGVDAHGRYLGTYKDPRRAGERITLRRTGATLDDLAASRRGDQVRVRPRTRYAKHVFGRFALFELGDRAVERLEQLTTDAFGRFLDQHREGP